MELVLINNLLMKSVLFGGWALFLVLAIMLFRRLVAGVGKATDPDVTPEAQREFAKDFWSRVGAAKVRVVLMVFFLIGMLALPGFMGAYWPKPDLSTEHDQDVQQRLREIREDKPPVVILEPTQTYEERREPGKETINDVLERFNSLPDADGISTGGEPIQPSK